MIATPKLHWLRFSIRDLFWLTLVVGMGIGWWQFAVEFNSLRDEERQLVSLYEQRSVLTDDVDRLRSPHQYFPESHNIDRIREAIEAELRDAESARAANEQAIKNLESKIKARQPKKSQ
jgi:hypothetical protein